MDLHIPAPSSSDGVYDVADPAPTLPTPAGPATELADGATAPPPAPATEVAQTPATAADKRAEPEKAAEAGKPAAVKPKKRKRRRRRFDAPAWAVSVLVHVGVLTLLGVATFSTEVRKVVANINSALV